MTWRPIQSLTRHRLAQHGLHTIASAGLLCRKAENLYPSLFTAVSVRESVLHVEVLDTQLLAFKSIQGPLVRSLNEYATLNQLPIISRVRLTITEGPDILPVTV